LILLYVLHKYFGTLWQEQNNYFYVCKPNVCICTFGILSQVQKMLWILAPLRRNLLMIQCKYRAFKFNHKWFYHKGILLFTNFLDIVGLIVATFLCIVKRQFHSYSVSSIWWRIAESCVYVTECSSVELALIKAKLSSWAWPVTINSQ